MKRTLALVCFALVIASTTTAFASDPLGVITSPRSVQWIPDKTTATEFVIHGTFELNKGGTTFSYSSPPTCGYAHFKCPAGSESLCRMQWSEIESVIGSGHCRGFGSLSKAPAVTIHTEGTPLGTPDTYDLGIGTQDVYGIGECSTQVSMKCDSTTSDAGPTDTGPTDGGTTDSGTTSDSGTPATDSGTEKDSGSIADTGTPPAPAPTQDSGGCSYGAAPASIGCFALALAAIGLFGRRRRR